MGDKQFHFIVSDGPQIPKDPTLRTIIRKQAMKDVGIARKRGNQSRIRHRQPTALNSATNASKRTEHSNGSSISAASSKCPRTKSTSPVTLDSDTEATSVEEIDEFLSSELELARYVPVAKEAYMAWTPPSLGVRNPMHGYEALRAKYYFDIQDLCILTSFNIGQSTMKGLAKNPELLSTLMGHRMCSYLAFVPSRYGTKPYLTAVVDCVTARAHSALFPPNAAFAKAVMGMYQKALRAVQQAVADEEACRDADLLCAVQMLSVHEIFDPSRAKAYSQHIAGSSELIRHRSPNNFKTDYEKLLFLSHVGPAMSEALYKNEHCYLAQPKWMKLYESLAEETTWLTESSPLAIRTRKQMIYLPGMLVDVERAMDIEAPYDGGLMLVLELKTRAIHKDLLDCLEDYKAHVVKTSFATPAESELALRRELFGSTLECLCLFKRILAALCDEERIRLETETQALAMLLLELQDQPSAKHSWLYKDAEYGVASIMRLTRETWEEKSTGLSAQEIREASCRRWEEFSAFFHRAEESSSVDYLNMQEATKTTVVYTTCKETGALYPVVYTTCKETGALIPQ